ncbi:piwi-like protein 1 [Dendrobates tinctorius]|uniref:piwi-like protein 1 n=1 Tax=Dendrobates tinctorius TaxID=92724 RepID=UPI003CC9DBE2
MTGRARSRARGRARGQEQAPQIPPGQAPQPQGPQPGVRPPQPQGPQPGVRPLQPQGPQPAARLPQPQGAWPAARPPQPQGAWPAARPPQPQGAWPAARPPQPQGAWSAVRPSQPQETRPAVRPQQPQDPWPALRPQQPQEPRPAVRPQQPQGPRPAVRPQQPQGPQPAVRPKQPQGPQPAVRPQQPQEPRPAVRPQQPQEPQPAVRPQQPAPEPLLVGRGRQRGAPAAERPSPEVLQVSAGLAEVSIGDRGGRRRDFHDVGVNTRQTIEHVQRSKAGTSGTIIALVTNHIKLVSRPQWALYQYHVDFNPAMESKRLRYALLYQHEETIGKARAFDGTVLFLPKRLNKVTEVFSQTRNGENVRITITLTNELPPTSPTCFHFYNIIFRRLLKIMDMKQIGRNYYNPNDATEVRAHRLSIWPGFSTSILQYESSIMLSIDVSHKVLRNETVHDIMSSLYSSCGPQRFQDACCKELIGQIVLTKYNNKTYRIDEIAWHMTPESTFKKADGSEISFVDYYKNQYNEQVKDLSQPLVVNIPRRPKPGATDGAIILVPELCNLTGLTDRMRNDFNVMKDLAVHTRLPPEQRERQVGKFLKYIHKDESVQKELRDWGLNFDTELLQFEGRIAPPERILQKDKTAVYDPQFADWSRELRGPVLLSTLDLNNWLLFYTRRNYDAANTLLQNMFKITQQLRIKMNRAVMVEVEDTVGGYLQAFQQNVTDRTEMVVCILSSNNKMKYDAIKKHLCVDFPIPSQCVVARTLSKPQTVLSVCTKIALQMNCKLGGELWSVEMPLEKTIIIGIDCYHDTLQGRRSIAGFVASTNKQMTRWFSRCVVQDQRQEIVDGLKFCMQAALHAWTKLNKDLPQRIIIYRDGVGDGQLKTLVNYEIPQIIDCIKSAGQNYSPKLTVVVVKKRINARFFAVMGGRLQNPPPGTIVDSEVTRPEWYDFFIISQSVRQGTVSPTHYNVVYDTIGLNPDRMQRLTYKLCHQYYNWPGVIRVPAPCQYAHKLAFLVGQSIHREPHNSLSNLLYYL